MSAQRPDDMDTVRAAFARLSPEERQAVGSSGDYAWESMTTLPARTRPEMLQFSVRVERDLFEGLQAMAEGQQATFSDVVRFALRNFVSRGGAVRGISNVYITTGPTRGPMSVEVPGQRAELAASRRIVSPDERVRRLVTGSDLSDDAVTAARV